MENKTKQIWRTVNIKPETKTVLEELGFLLGNGNFPIPQSGVLEYLIKTKHAELTKAKS